VTLKVKSAGQEYLVADQGPQGTVHIPWITTAVATFEVYSASTLLSTLDVKGSTTQDIHTQNTQTPNTIDAAGTLTATPNPCILGADGKCTTTLSWTTSNTTSVQIHVRNNNAQPDYDHDPLVAAAPSGSTEINWITDFNPTFDLYDGGKLVTSLQIRGVHQ
jgi:hypothetical protein